jgi:hypothetical protein
MSYRVRSAGTGRPVVAACTTNSSCTAFAVIRVKAKGVWNFGSAWLADSTNA